MEKRSFNPYIFKIVSIAALLALFCLCGRGPKKNTHRFFALDTIIDVTLYSNSSKVKKDLESLERLVCALDTQLSISQPKSDVYRINHRADSVQTVSGALKEILAACRREWERSTGLFDVTVEPLKFLYGLESHQEKHHVPSASERADALARIGFNKIKFINDSTLVFPDDMRIDLGGIAKGYVLEKASRFLKSKGHASFMLNLGGDLIVNGTKPAGKPWIIGIRDPRNEQSLIARLLVSGIAVFTSGDYERYFIENDKRYNHIFNPKTGLPGSCNRSATVVGEYLFAVDAAVKTAFLMPAPEALSYLDSRGMQGLIIDSVGVGWASKGLKNILNADMLTVNFR